MHNPDSIYPHGWQHAAFIIMFFYGDSRFRYKLFKNIFFLSSYYPVNDVIENMQIFIGAYP